MADRWHASAVFSRPLTEHRPAYSVGMVLQAHRYRTAAIGNFHLDMRMPYRNPEDDRPNPPKSGDPGIAYIGIDHRRPYQPRIRRVLQG